MGNPSRGEPLPARGHLRAGPRLSRQVPGVGVGGWAPGQPAVEAPRSVPVPRLRPPVGGVVPVGVPGVSCQARGAQVHGGQGPAPRPQHPRIGGWGPGPRSRRSPPRAPSPGDQVHRRGDGALRRAQSDRSPHADHRGRRGGEEVDRLAGGVAGHPSPVPVAHQAGHALLSRDGAEPYGLRLRVQAHRCREDLRDPRGRFGGRGGTRDRARRDVRGEDEPTPGLPPRRVQEVPGVRGAERRSTR